MLFYWYPFGGIVSTTFLQKGCYRRPIRFEVSSEGLPTSLYLPTEARQGVLYDFCGESLDSL